MKELASGRIWKFGDGIDTDALAPTRYLNQGEAEYPKHCLEAVNPEFANGAKIGDIIVAGEEFGRGSSREHAAKALKLLGIKAVIAKSISPIYKRNLINLGIPIFEDPDIPDACEDGDMSVIGPGRFHNITKGWDSPLPALPDFILEIIEKGGLFPMLLEKGGISAMARPLKDNGEMKEVGGMRVFPANEKYVDTVVDLLNRGEVLLGPFDTTYGLFASIKRPDAIKRIYAMKKRAMDMPLTMIVPREKFSQYAEIPEKVKRLLLKELDGPISIILPKKKDKVPDHVTSGLPTVSLADGENAFMKRVMERIEICGTSANIHGEAPPSTLSGALAQLGDSVTLAVDGGPSLYKIGHTVLDLASDPPKLVRAGPFDTKKIYSLFPELVADRTDPIPDELVKGSSIVDLTPKVVVKASKRDG